MSETNIEEWMDVKKQASGVTTEQLDLLAKQYSDKYDEYEKKKAESTRLFNEATEIENSLIAMLTDAGKDKYYVEGVGLFTKSSRDYVKTPKTIEAKQAFFGYLLEKHGETFYWDKISVNAQTLQTVHAMEQKLADERKEVDFKFPGLEAPTALTTLKFRGEK